MRQAFWFVFEAVVYGGVPVAFWVLAKAVFE